LDTKKIITDHKLHNAHIDQTVYVVLEKHGKYWEAVALHTSRPHVKTQQVLIAGKINGMYLPTVRIRYGIETYFVPEEMGSKLESVSGRFDVEASVTKNGHALIKRVLLNGKPVSLRPEQLN
jgi:uncharacterized membrane-anchored protein